MKLRPAWRRAASLARDPNADIMTPEWKAVIRRDPCVFCNETGGELDHIRPRVNGGKHGWTNIASACKFHNTMKSGGPLWWMLWRLNEQRLGYVKQQPIRFRRTRKGVLLAIEWMTVYTRKLKTLERTSLGTTRGSEFSNDALHRDTRKGFSS